jgi:hypothetical protein
MEELLLTASNEILDELDMSFFHYISDLEHQQYFINKSSLDHYRLLSFISNSFNNVSILDIGTYKGCSAISLSTNKSNRIFSFNLVNQLNLNGHPENIQFIIDDVLDKKYESLIKDSPIIFLDTYHDGTFEQKFLDNLIRLNYKGCLLLDDIHLNQEMSNFWNKIELKKIDLTSVGHASGTGAVIFE